MDVTMKCPCPPKGENVRHPAGDTVTLRDRLDYRTVVTIRKSRTTVGTEDDAVRLAERLAIITEFYMLLGITVWTFVDANGKPVEVSHKAIREILFEAEDVETVSEAAEELYNPVVLFPLVERASSSSPPTPTDESTSVTSTPPRPLRPPKPSSTSTSRTAGTVTTTSSPDGDSSSSPSSVSAA